MADYADGSTTQLEGKGKFYDPQGRYVDDCRYSLEAITLGPDEVKGNGLPEFVTKDRGNDH